IAISAGEGTRLTLTTAAAEKVYRAPEAPARLDISLKGASGAHLAWLPQETIMFDRAKMLRTIDIDLAENASLLLCESVVFGRAAM
ncbi:urease accessory protein UreD, partial [Acinetobacter baumannii]